MNELKMNVLYDMKAFISFKYQSFGNRQHHKVFNTVNTILFPQVTV